MECSINNAAKMMFVTFILMSCLLLQRCTITSGSTHWIVTEDGRIQSQPDSVYNLRRPYDLVAFMKQEDRATMLNGLKKELLSRKDEIDKNEDRETGLEQKFYKTNPDCIEAGKPLPEFDLYISTVLPLENKGIRPEEHIDVNGAPSSSPKAPDCTSFMGLEFSMHAFEHLEGMKARSNLSGTPELGLKNAITHRENVDDYGHLVYEALHKNKTSWILYNMAAFYWRIKGNPHQAVECIRRALHHSPRHQKDVALISLANILHRARFSNEAAILVHSALEVSKELNVNHFTLGNIYAVLGEYNKSIICFENTLKIQPDFEAASKRRFAVLCHSKLELALEAQHRSLQRTLMDLKDYQRKHDLYQMQSDKLLSEQVPHEVKMAQHFAYEQQKSRERSAQMDEYCRMVDRNGKQVLLCTWSRRVPKLDFDFAYLDEDTIESSNDEIEIGNEINASSSDGSALDYSLPVRAPMYSKYKKYKPTETDSYTLENWPDKEECDSLVKKVPDSNNQTTVYLSPENKGFEVKKLLTEAQGLVEGDEHLLPWYPPVCVPLMELDEGNPLVYDHLKSVSYAERSRIILRYIDPSMRKILLSHVNGGSITEEEVGQRILTALKKNIGPPWILYNLAGLYWRINGNNSNGIECLRRSIYLTPPQYKDIPLVNLANILYRYGRYDDAITIMRDALAVSDVEPSSHFLMAHLLWATRNYTGAAHHYKEALAADPAYEGALESLRAMKCFLKFHHAAQSAAPQESAVDTVSSNCQPKGAETESRVICKTENNEEKCIIETRSRNRVADCNGQCTQTCTISPVKMDGCSGEINLENAIIGHCSGGKGGKPFSSDQEDILFSGDFTSRLDEVSEYYEKKGLCLGDECSHLRVQCLLPMTTHAGLIAHVITPPKLFVRPVAFHASQCLQHSGPKPHTKLEFVEGVLKQKLIFLQVAPSEMEVNPEDCIIFNDGTRSSGCNREEFRTYMEELDRDILALRQRLSEGEGSDMFLLSRDYLDDDTKEEETVPEESTQRRQAESSRDNGNPQVPKSLAPPMPALPISPYPDRLLPDTSMHVGERARLPMTKSQCDRLDSGTTVFDKYESTWLLFTSKDIELRDYIDFTTDGEELQDEELVCDSGLVSPVISFGHLPGVMVRSEVKMKPEMKLTETFKTLGGQPSTVEIVKAQIIDAMEENSTSWISYHLASLYWRIEGKAENAIDCLRVALTMAPHPFRDVPLIGLANVLLQMGYANDAVIVTNAALHISSDVIESLYTMANVYSNKGEWDKTVLFLQTILAKLPGFQHAELKLKEIYCDQLATPSLFNI